MKQSAAGIPFYLFILTIDRFIDINDEHGYLNGDEVIKAAAVIVKKSVKIGYALSRFGGTEFFLVFTGTTEEEALEQIQAIEATSNKVRFKQFPDLKIKINTGFLASDPNDTSINQVIKRAHKSRL
jgi:diguanylate cyclase (GGDEF)-like protein